jgi:predicted RNase H-like HicB family nuclease
MMDVTGYAVIIERSTTGYGGYAPELPGVGVTGSTIDEVKRLIRETVVLHIDSLREHGEPVPPPSVVATTVVEVPAA